MANRYNRYIPTQYVGMPIQEYQYALAHIDDQATQKVQQLGRAFASFGDITPVGKDATAFYQETLGALRQNIEGVGKQQLTAFDATNQIQKMISDPNTIGAFKNVYQDAMDYNKMLEYMSEYRKKNPDINLLPQVRSLDQLNAQKGVAGNYKPGAFRGMTSAPDYYSVPKAVYAAVEKMKANKDTWQKLVGNKIYTTTEEALTDDRVVNAAMKSIYADPEAMDQIRRSMDYEAYRMNPQNPQEYINTQGAELRNRLLDNVKANTTAITALKAGIAKKTKGFDVAAAEAQIKRMETENEALNTISQRQDSELAGRAFLNRYTDAAAAIFPYHERSQTWKYDDLFMEDYKFQHQLALQRAKAKDDDKRMQEMAMLFRPQAVAQPRFNLDNVEVDSPTSTTAFTRHKGLEVLNKMGKNVHDLNFSKPVEVVTTAQEMAEQGILTKADFKVTGKNNLLNVFTPFPLMELTQEARNRLAKQGITITDQKQDRITYTVKPKITDVVTGLKETYGDLDFNMGEGFNTGKKDKNGNPIFKKITLSENMSEEDLKTYLGRVTQYEHDNQLQGVNSWSPGGPQQDAYESMINQNISSSLNDRVTYVNGKKYIPGKDPIIVKVDGKNVSFGEVLRSNNKLSFRNVPKDGVMWHVYETIDEDGKKQSIRVAGDPNDNAAVVGPSAVAASNKSGLIFDPYARSHVYVQTELGQGDYGIAKKQAVTMDVDHPVLRNASSEYVRQYVAMQQAKGTGGKDYAQLVQDAMARLEELYNSTSPKAKGMEDNVVGVRIPFIMKPVKNPDGSYMTTPEGLPITMSPRGIDFPDGTRIGGTISPEEYQQATITRRYEENALQNVQLGQPAKNTLYLWDMLNMGQAPNTYLYGR